MGSTNDNLGVQKITAFNCSNDFDGVGLPVEQKPVFTSTYFQRRLLAVSEPSV